MRKVSAHYIINPGEKPIRNGIIELDDEERIINIRANDQFKEESHLEFYNGVLVPGFVNVHTHLELSHLKGRIPQGTGISRFVNEIVKARSQFTPDDKGLENELSAMHLSGTQAVGDISNANHSIQAKASSRIIFHTFIELFGLNPENAQWIWESGIKLKEEFSRDLLIATVSPHAPYSVSADLWKKFKDYKEQHHLPISVHHMESEQEELFFRTHQGEMADRFIRMGIDPKYFPQPKQASTEWLSRQLPDNKTILLIHNTFSTLSQLEKLQQNHVNTDFFFGICPNSNLYIENHLPEEIIKHRQALSVCLGTDSLASTHSLNIWEEIKTLANAFPEIRIEEFIEMACANGARALHLDKEIGSFQIGKKPGVVLIEGLNLQKLQVTSESKTRRII